ncbi:MAG: DNA primase [Lachnospiraceae bacterium]|nr:DNA primase [Lachnospiraceae bacterium]
MPRIKDEVIDEIRSRNDIVDVIGSVIKLKRKGANYFGLCPFHNEKTGSFCVSPQRQTYHCFGCDAGGNVISFVMEYENYSYPEALRYLAERAGIEIPEAEETPEEKREARFKGRVLECLKDAAIYYYKKLYSPEGRIGLEYFRNRGLTDGTIKSFGLGYSGKGRDQTVRYLKSKGYTDKEINAAGLCNISEKYGMTDRFFNRVMFPIMDINSKVIGFGARVMGSGEPKYLNSPEGVVFDKSRNMYGLNVARRSRSPYRIVCEGYMDVITMHQAGFTEATASLGTAFTSGHANLLRRYTDDIRLTYDSDAPGQKALMRAIPICRSAGLSTKVIHLDPYKDPDELIKAMGAEEFRKRVEAAENSFFFELSYIERSYDMSDPDGRTSFQNEAARKLASIDDELARDNYISGVAEKYFIREDALRRAVAIAIEKNERSGPSDFETRPHARINNDRAPSDRSHAADGQAAHPNEGIDMAERYLLTWMVDEKEVFEAAKNYLAPEDYTDGINREMAQKIYEGYEKGSISPADILTGFVANDNSNEASSVINTPLDAVETPDDRARALTDLVIKIKEAALNRDAGIDDGTDPLKKAKQIKHALTELKKIKISL